MAIVSSSNSRLTAPLARPNTPAAMLPAQAERWPLMNAAAAFIKGHLSAWAGNIAAGVFGLAKGAVSLLFELLTIAMFSFYFVAEGPRIRRGVCSLFRPAWQRAILQLSLIHISEPTRLGMISYAVF